MRLFNSTFQTQLNVRIVKCLAILRSGAGKLMKYVLGVAELAIKLIIVQLNRDAQIAVERTLPITSGVMLTLRELPAFIFRNWVHF